jgi:3-deoxy-manno-octulosonate cytidylyltransferase (CMP-KDO synthetase)
MVAKKKTILVMIPARYNSEEIFCKTLADIGGKPMIQHVYERVAKAAGVSRVMGACDHEKIKDAVEGFGGKAILTGKHICGTDRIVEGYSKLGEKFDVIVDVQADEPFVEPRMIEEVTKPLLEDPRIPMATICCEFGSEADWKYPFNVKVVKDLDGFALYFTRSPVPFPRKKEGARFFQHVGIYAWQGWFLEKYPPTPSPLELAESLEQLRVLENGYKIKVVETTTAYKKVAVNTPEDLERARKLMLERAK